MVQVVRWCLVARKGSSSDETDSTCHSCAGTGEGSHEGANCMTCKGSGEIK